ncbi:hypothetical protein BTN49_1790 [Candidatus Enterovibrio escicola]|uniref:Uncharacterized protein n=1 Tax=Candidatus Enterovibrio escicola TaxID=1927127 RepID=A0A2A5T323_9GAMM|nr:hypothetical protein BTN49_1790 [Candidatus Enterovibrio escacola]
MPDKTLSINSPTLIKPTTPPRVESGRQKGRMHETIAGIKLITK